MTNPAGGEGGMAQNISSTSWLLTSMGLILMYLGQGGSVGEKLVKLCENGSVLLVPISTAFKPGCN